MKSEPDRLDLLVVLLPVALVAVLGVQTYHFFKSREGRVAGAALTAQVDELAATKLKLEPVPPAPAPTTGTQPQPTPERAPEESDASAAAQPAEDAASDRLAAAAAAAATPSPGANPDGSDPDPAGAAPSPSSPVQNLAASEPRLPAPQPAEGGEAPNGAAAVPSASPARATPGAGGTVLGGAAAQATAPPASTPGDEPPAPRPKSTSRGAVSRGQDAEPPARENPARPARVSATPQTSEVGVGQVFPVEIRIASGTNVASVPFHLKFDPKVLKLNSTPRSERGPFLAQDGSDPQFLVATGPAGDEVIIGLSLLGASAGADGDGLLCTLFFVAVAPGISPLQFSHASVRGPDARMLPATFQPGAIKVNG